MFFQIPGSYLHPLGKSRVWLVLGPWFLLTSFAVFAICALEINLSGHHRETVIYISPFYFHPPKWFVTILSGRSCWLISEITPSYFYLPAGSHGQQEFYPRQLAFRLFPVSLATEPDVNRYLTGIWTSRSLS